jgi:hypothetical protein
LGDVTGENRLMKITYQDGTSVPAILLSRTAGRVRVAVSGDDEARTFTQVSGAWVSEYCDLVAIDFEGRTGTARDVSNVTECVYSKQFARQLIAQLLNPVDDLPRKDLLYVFSAEGRKVRIQQTEMLTPGGG